MVIIKTYYYIPITAYGAENRQLCRIAAREMNFVRSFREKRVDREMNEEVRERLNVKMENNTI